MEILGYALVIIGLVLVILPALATLGIIESKRNYSLVPPAPGMPWSNLSKRHHGSPSLGLF